MPSKGRRAAVTAARRRGRLHRAGGDRRVGRAVDARRSLATRRAGRVWLSARAAGGSEYAYLRESHD